MGTATIQSELWGKAPHHWSELQEPLHTPLFEAMLEATQVGAGTRVFDAGCGSGVASLLAAQRGAHVSGLDATAELIAIAQERVPAGDFRVGDLEHLPFADRVFDAVIAANSLQYTGDRMATLRELARVCTVGGRVAVGLFGPPEAMTLTAFFKVMGEALPEPTKGGGGGGPFELSTPGKLEALLTEAGLHVLASDVANCVFAYPDFETMWQANSSAGPTQGLIRAVGEERVKETMARAAAPFRQDDGSITIGPNHFRYVVATVRVA